MAKTDSLDRAEVETGVEYKQRAQRQFTVLFRAYEDHKRYELRVLGQAIVVLSVRAAMHEKEGETEARDALRELVSRLTEVAEVIDADSLLPETDRKNHSSIV
jgi:plasmid stability protein